MKFKKGTSPNQEVLIPKKASDFLPDKHLAKIIYDVVETLDILPIIIKYSEIGQNAYHPKMILRLLILSLFNWNFFFTKNFKFLL